VDLAREISGLWVRHWVQRALLSMQAIDVASEIVTASAVCRFGDAFLH
jgi:hypothetical protein